MITLRDSVEIRTTPEKVFEWFMHFDENYVSWHPDHVKCSYLKGKQFEEGSVLYAEEYLHGKLHRMKFLTREVEPNKRVEYRMLFPASIICKGGSFIMEGSGKGCLFTAILYFRFGRIFSKFLRARVEAIKKHMREEGENLKRILEGNGG